MSHDTNYMKSFKKYWSIFQITLLNSLAYPGAPEKFRKVIVRVMLVEIAEPFVETFLAGNPG